MKFIRYTQATDNSIDGWPRVCQLQYDEGFIQDIRDYEYGLSRINKQYDETLSLNIFGYKGIEVAFGDILHDDRQEGEFFEMEETEVFDGLPDETSFDDDSEIEFNNLVVTPGWVTIIGHDKSGNEISAEILIDDLKPFV